MHGKLNTLSTRAFYSYTCIYIYEINLGRFVSSNILQKDVCQMTEIYMPRTITDNKV